MLSKMSRRKQSKPQHVEFPDNKNSLVASDTQGRKTSSEASSENPVSEHGSATCELEATQGKNETTDDTRDVDSDSNSEDAANPEKPSSVPFSASDNTVHMAVHRASLVGFDASSEFSPESLAAGHGQYISSHRSLLYPRYNGTLDAQRLKTWSGTEGVPDSRGGQSKNQDKDSESVLEAIEEREKRPRQGESGSEMYTCDHCNKNFEILHDYIRHRDFECSENSPHDDISPDEDDRSSGSKDVPDTNGGGYVISGNVIMATEQELINQRRGSPVEDEYRELRIDEQQCVDESARSNSKGKRCEDVSNDPESSNTKGCHNTRTVSPGSADEANGVPDNKADHPFVRNGDHDHCPAGEDDQNRNCDMAEAAKLSKDIMAAEAMAHAIQNMSTFASQSGSSERPDISAIKYQVRMIQQQQAYQVQMLNFLQWQLALASNPNNAMSAAGRSFNGGLPMNPTSLPSGFLPGAPPMPGNPFMPQMMAAMAMNNFQNSGDSNGMTDLAKARLMMSMQQPQSADASHPLRSFFPPSIGEPDDSTRNEHEQRYQLKVATEADREQNLENSQDKTDNPPKSDSSFEAGDRASNVSGNGIADDASSSHGSHEEGELRDSALKSTAEEHRHRCRFCHKIFGSDSALQIHIRSHTGERPFKCNICGNRFTTKGNLKVHFTRHKSRYPHIPMNDKMIPEYLDHVLDSNGLPCGMSILPEKAALERPRLHGNPSIHLSPQQAALLNQRDTSSQKIANLFPPQVSALKGKVDSELLSTERQDSVDSAEDRFGAANMATALQAQLLQRQRAELLESQWSNGDNKNADMLDSRDPKSQMALLQAAMLPFLPGFAARQQLENVPPHMRYLLPQQLSALQSQMAGNVAHGNGTGLDIRLPTLPQSTRSHMNNVIKHDRHSLDNMASRSQVSSSETSKLQRLVENIDSGRVLQKNECRICHRILSCQSALKLHYRTHTGERPYKCDLCSRAFTTRGNLRTHYSSVHRQQMRPLPPSNSRSSNTESYNCTLCTARFRDAIEFQRHVHMHAMVQQQQQKMLELEQRTVCPIDESSITQKAGESSTRDENVSVKSEGSLRQSTSQLQGDEDLECKEEDEGRLSESPNPEMDDNLRHSMSHESSNDGVGHVTPIKLENEDDGRDSTVRTPPIMTNPLDSLAALSNISNGADGALHTGSMLDHQLAALNRARAGRLTVCEICEKPFSCQSALEIHLRTHTKERPFICQICQRAFTTKGNLKQHLLTHNITDIPEQMLAPMSSPNNSRSTSSSPSSSPTPSDSRVVSSQKRISDVVDASEPPTKRTFPRHWCHICQKQFSSASSLQIHNRTHTGEKPFACTVCGRAFTTKGNLKVHMGTHVWGAGGSRRGRRISMDNPLISPWMKNMTRAQPSQPMMPLPPSGQVADPAALYQQYAALARDILSAKQDAASRFMLPMTSGQSGNSAASPVSSNGSPLPHGELASPKSRATAGNNPNISAATEWFLKAYQRTQEQVN